MKALLSSCVSSFALGRSIALGHLVIRLSVLPLFLASSMLHAGVVVVVDELSTNTADRTVDSWVVSSLVGGGSVSLVGDPPVGAPGALRLSTGFDNADKAEVTTYADFGDAATMLGSLQLEYTYYKETVSGGNVFAAPALRLILSTPDGTGDNYGSLVYEPYWNQPGGGAPPAPADAWQNVSIDSSSGAGADASGGWWWNGGFEIDNSAGGPPLRSLNEWVSVFQASDMIDFGNARIVAISLSVGSYNQGQLGYVDSLSIEGSGGLDTTYNFGAVVIPEPSVYAAVLGLLAMGIVVWRRQKS